MYLVLDRESPTGLTEQLFGALKRLILDGTLPAGTCLPATRSLAEEMKVSRTVVVTAFERLSAEGFVEARQGAGTFVAEGARLLATSGDPAAVSHPGGHAALEPQVGFGPLRSDIIDFRTGVPDLREFPVSTWQRLQREVWDSISPADLAYGAPEGRIELRRALSVYLRVHRGVDCAPEQIILTSGTTQAIALVSSTLGASAAPARLRETRGRHDAIRRPIAIVEDPVTGDIPRIIERNGVEVLHLPIDGAGLDARQFPEQPNGGGPVAFVYVTPSHHYPLGVSTPIDRRVGLVEYARRQGCYLVEDDYDSEFRYRLPPVSTLFELDPDRVLYIGTFSKTLSPALRTAFIVSPWGLVRELRAAKWHADLHGASPDQLVLARLLEEGIYARHLLRMRRLYERKWQVLRDALEEHFRRRIDILGSPAGMHVAVRFSGAEFGGDLLERVERSGAKFYPLSMHTVHPRRWDDCLVIGFGHLDPERIRQGISLLADALG